MTWTALRKVCSKVEENFRVLSALSPRVFAVEDFPGDAWTSRSAGAINLTLNVPAWNSAKLHDWNRRVILPSNNIIWTGWKLNQNRNFPPNKNFRIGDSEEIFINFLLWLTERRIQDSERKNRKEQAFFCLWWILNTNDSIRLHPSARILRDAAREMKDFCRCETRHFYEP